MPTHTIAENLERLNDAKTAIAEAITTAGGTVNSGDGLEDFATDITTIPSGNSNTVYDGESYTWSDWIETFAVPEDVESLRMSSVPQSYQAPNLGKIIIPSTVTSIDSTTFNGVSSQLTEIIIKKPQDSITGAPWGAPSSVTITWTG